MSLLGKKLYEDIGKNTDNVNKKTGGGNGKKDQGKKS